MTELLDFIANMGDSNFIKSDQIFCFGDRQTGKTYNMILKSYYNAIKYFMEYKEAYEFIISIITPTVVQGEVILDKIPHILKNFRCTVKNKSKKIVIIEDEFNHSVEFNIDTVESIRSKKIDYYIIDEAPFIKNIKECLINLIYNNCVFIVGGSSYYSMGINPNISNEKYVKSVRGVLQR